MLEGNHRDIRAPKQWLSVKYEETNQSQFCSLSPEKEIFLAGQGSELTTSGDMSHN